MRKHVCGIAWLALVIGPSALFAGQTDWPMYPSNPFQIDLEITYSEDSAGGIVVADLTGDGRMDYLMTVPGHVAAYANDGRKLWLLKTDVRVDGSSEREGLPGHHGPGVQAADVDGDGKTKVLFLTQSRTLQVVDGTTGQAKWSATPPVPEKAERWEHLVVTRFRDKDRVDVLLQVTNAKGYRVGHMLAAYAIDDLRERKYKPLWERNDFLTCAHNGARVADLNGDGLDEVLGGDIIDGGGKLLVKIPLKGHIDSIFVADVRPDIKGLEVIALEEGGGNRVFLYNHERVIWETHYKHWEPQNAAIGEFDPARPGLEIWCRSRFDENQKPFVFDAEGKQIAAYEMSQVAPKDWTNRGVELIHTVDWTGEAKQLAAAKERHKSGDVALFDPMTGTFVQRFSTKADRLYVADVAGDWREELIVLSGNKLLIYQNEEANPNPDRPRLWTKPQYRRSKMTWNYYSP